MSHLSGASSPDLQVFADPIAFDDCGESGARNGKMHISRPPVQPGQIEKIIDARRLRASFFDSDLFADPAWDMLLDLYRAHLAQQRICVTSVCFGAGVPVSTALRWLNALEQRNLAKRSQDPLDGRRFFVALTDEGASAMAKYFSATKPLAI